MQTSFRPERLADPAMKNSEQVIRNCVHCGFCTATCPTYVLLGDERDSPRGRIYMIKDMLENDRVPSAEVVKHVDRCLSCLSCMTTCPSGVNYMHLVDHARAYIQENYRRPLTDRMMRRLLAFILPYSGRFRLAMQVGRLVKWTAPLLDRTALTRPLAAMLRLAPAHMPAKPSMHTTAHGAAKGRVALLQGCAEPVLQPQIRAATIRLLERAGYDVIFAAGEGCCGALVHHMGREDDSLAAARRNVDAWTREIENGGLDAILVTTSGCGTTVKDYGFMLRDDPHYAQAAAAVSALALDISQFLSKIELPPARGGMDMKIAYHAACSLQHGQKVTNEPPALLRAVGFEVLTPAESHLCCGSAGTYNILQPEIAGQLRDRKVAQIERLKPDAIAAGNVGCAMQIGSGTGLPVLHTVELLDWATGGPVPEALRNHTIRQGV